MLRILLVGVVVALAAGCGASAPPTPPPPWPARAPTVGAEPVRVLVHCGLRGVEWRGQWWEPVGEAPRLLPVRPNPDATISSRNFIAGEVRPRDGARAAVLTSLDLVGPVALRPGVEPMPCS